MERKIRIGLLGAGAMGSMHAAVYAAMTDVEVVGIFSRHRPTPGADTRIEDPTVDAIDICLPTALHHRYAMAALANGKHVFCETPLAATLEEAEEMAAAARRSGRLLQVGLLMRSVAAYQHVKQVVEGGTEGRLLGLSTWRLGSYLRKGKAHYGDPALELMTFDFDVVNWLMGTPDRLTAAGSAEIAALLEWDDGRSATVAASGMMPLDIPFTSGFRALFEDAAFEFEAVFDGSGPPRSTFSVPVEDRNPYDVELRRFVDCIHGRADAELLDAERAVEALRLSFETRRQTRPATV